MRVVMAEPRLGSVQCDSVCSHCATAVVAVPEGPTGMEVGVEALLQLHSWE